MGGPFLAFGLYVLELFSCGEIYNVHITRYHTKGGGEETYDTLLQTSDDLTHLERSVLGDSVVVQTEFALQLNFW